MGRQVLQVTPGASSPRAFTIPNKFSATKAPHTCFGWSCLLGTAAIVAARAACRIFFSIFFPAPLSAFSCTRPDPPHTTCNTAKLAGCPLIDAGADQRERHGTGRLKCPTRSRVLCAFTRRSRRSTRKASRRATSKRFSSRRSPGTGTTRTRSLRRRCVGTCFARWTGIATGM